MVRYSESLVFTNTSNVSCRLWSASNLWYMCTCTYLCNFSVKHGGPEQVHILQLPASVCEFHFKSKHSDGSYPYFMTCIVYNWFRQKMFKKKTFKKVSSNSQVWSVQHILWLKRITTQINSFTNVTDSATRCSHAVQKVFHSFAKAKGKIEQHYTFFFFFSFLRFVSGF